MHPLVRDLYKKLLTVGRDYPAGLDHVRDRAKREIFGRRCALQQKQQESTGSHCG